MSSFKWLLIFFALTASCGGSLPSSVDGKIDLGVDWKSPEGGVSLSKYAGLISARASVASLEPVEILPEDGIYHFELGQIESGHVPVLLEFIYAGSVIADIETVVQFKGEPVEIFLSRDEVTPSDPDRSVAELILNIAALPVSDVDSDGVNDSDEFLFGTSPLMADTDSDGLADGAEISLGCDPRKNDSDDDGVGDGEDKFPVDEFESADADGDGVGDNSDNCKMAPNANQLDADNDGVGDECSADDDGDGLHDVDEIKFGCDPSNADSDFDGLSDSYEIQKGLNPISSDSDGDTADDAADLFPLDALEAFDADVDGVGDNGDNCPYVANRDQQNTDEEYFARGVKTLDGNFVAPDVLGDACDSDPDGDGEDSVFVSFSSTEEKERGTFLEPYRSIGPAVEKAAVRGDAVKVAFGTYDVRDVDFSKIKKMTGGYSGDFSSRSVMNAAGEFKTELINSTSPVVVALTSAESSLELDGFFIKSGSVQDDVGGVLPDNSVFVCFSSAVFASNAELKIKNSILNGSAESQASCGILADRGATLLLDNVVVKGEGAAQSVRSSAIVAQNSNVTVLDSVFSAGRGKYATGLTSEASQVSISNSVVDGTSRSNLPKSSTAIKFSGGALYLEANKIFTASSLEQTVLVCGGERPQTGRIKNNTFVTFSNSGANSVLFDCEGNFVGTLAFEKSQASICRFDFECLANQAYTGSLNDLFDDIYDIL